MSPWHQTIAPFTCPLPTRPHLFVWLIDVQARNTSNHHQLLPLSTSHLARHSSCGSRGSDAALSDRDVPTTGDPAINFPALRLLHGFHLTDHNREAISLLVLQNTFFTKTVGYKPATAFSYSLGRTTKSCYRRF